MFEQYHLSLSSFLCHCYETQFIQLGLSSAQLCLTHTLPFLFGMDYRLYIMICLLKEIEPQLRTCIAGVAENNGIYIYILHVSCIEVAPSLLC